jgi:hypothetical protein
MDLARISVQAKLTMAALLSAVLSKRMAARLNRFCFLNFCSMRIRAAYDNFRRNSGGLFRLEWFWRPRA